MGKCVSLHYVSVKESIETFIFKTQSIMQPPPLIVYTTAIVSARYVKGQLYNGKYTKNVQKLKAI